MQAKMKTNLWCKYWDGVVLPGTFQVCLLYIYVATTLYVYDKYVQQQLFVSLQNEVELRNRIINY